MKYIDNIANKNEKIPLIKKSIKLSWGNNSRNIYIGIDIINIENMDRSTCLIYSFTEKLIRYTIK